MSWLADVALLDELPVAAAAAMWVESGMQPTDWLDLTTAERAAVVAARQELRALVLSAELAAKGDPMGAARALVPADGGVSAARALAAQNAEEVAAELFKRRGAHGVR